MDQFFLSFFSVNGRTDGCLVRPAPVKLFRFVLFFKGRKINGQGKMRKCFGWKIEFADCICVREIPRGWSDWAGKKQKKAERKGTKEVGPIDNQFIRNQLVAIRKRRGIHIEKKVSGRDGNAKVGRGWGGYNIIIIDIDVSFKGLRKSGGEWLTGPELFIRFLFLFPPLLARENGTWLSIDLIPCSHYTRHTSRRRRSGLEGGG